MEMLVYILFCLFFTVPILSPTISGTRIYLYMFIPIFDINYLKFIFKIIVEKNLKVIKIRLYFLLLLFNILFIQGGTIAVLKLFFMVLVVMYLIYSFKDKKKIKILKNLFLINSFIALIQLLEFYSLGKVTINPVEIAKYIYGTQNSVNFGNIFSEGNPVLGKINLSLRVAGLSTEPGYLNSLLIAGYIFFNDYNYLNKKEKIIFYLGILSSFSKIGVLITLFYIIVKKLRKYLNKIPKSLIIIILVISMSIITNINFDKIYNLGNKTWYHRTIGYKVLSDLDWKDFFTGIGFRQVGERKKEFDYLKYSQFYDNMPEIMIDNSGLSTIFIDHGVIVIIIMIIILYLTNVSSYTLSLFLIGTLNVNPFTSLSFVYVYYLNMFYKGENKK